MNIGKMIAKLRTETKLTQAQFAEIFGVSQQSVQKWESGASAPDLEKIVLMSKYFDVSLDAFILGNDKRIVEEQNKAREIKPQYHSLPECEFYASNLQIEYTQSIDEGLDIERYRDIFSSVSLLANGEIKKKLADVLFEVVINADQKQGYPYVEPSELEKIKELRNGHTTALPYDKKRLPDRIRGAWMGRVCGCMHGKPLEGIHTDELIPFLKETDNYPLHRYVYRSDLTEEMNTKYKFHFANRRYADEVDGMPADDDTNYTVLAQEIIRKCGKEFTPSDVAEAWLRFQRKNAYCTAERVAYCNFVKGYAPPASAIYQNPYREWIGAQIRGDYFGYINPGNPEKAAEMAWRDASISHVKNGIYGEMLVAAMLAVAASTSDIKTIVRGGLSQIPSTSRLYEALTRVMEDYERGVSQRECFDAIHRKYDEHSEHDWCHTISNAMIVVASLLYGGGDYGKSICMAVETGFDTDCNGATVGSILGMANGIQSIPEYWTSPIKDCLYTSIFGFQTVKISERVQLTLEQIEE